MQVVRVENFWIFCEDMIIHSVNSKKDQKHESKRNKRYC